jgi:hypothetical protein
MKQCRGVRYDRNVNLFEVINATALSNSEYMFGSESKQL